MCRPNMVRCFRLYGEESTEILQSQLGRFLAFFQSGFESPGLWDDGYVWIRNLTPDYAAWDELEHSTIRASHPSILEEK